MYQSIMDKRDARKKEIETGAEVSKEALREIFTPMKQAARS